MTEKRVKAWAVVDKDGKLVKWNGRYQAIPRHKVLPKYFTAADQKGERVVPVEIVIKEGE